MLWVILGLFMYAVINEHERVCREHAYGPHDFHAAWSLWPSGYTTLKYETGDRDRFPARFIFLIL
jgi:hypothetical protein